MKTMGIRELKTHLSDALRELQETGETIEITHHGAPVARIVPIRKQSTEQERRAIIDSLDSLAAQIGAHWPEGVTALEAVRDVRREL